VRTPEKIKVLYVVGQLSVGGTELQLLHLIKGLDRNRFEPMVVCLSGIFVSLSYEFQQCDISLVLLDREEKGRLKVFARLWRILRKFKPDITHAFGYASRVAIPVSKLASEAKNIVSIRTQPEWQANWLDRIINSLADQVLTNSRYTADLIYFGFLKRVPVRVIYNGIDLYKFDISSRENLNVSFEQNVSIMGVVARLDPVKGLDVLLQAFAIMCKSMSNIRLWIVGDGPEKKRLQDQATCLNIESKVVFWLQRRDIPAILRYVRIGVLSSHHEGLPNAVIEYMAAGLPVVATNVGGLAELVKHNSTGFLVPVNNPQELANAIIKLLNNPLMDNRFGLKGREFVEQALDMAKMIVNTEDVYTELMRR